MLTVSLPLVKPYKFLDCILVNIPVFFFSFFDPKILDWGREGVVTQIRRRHYLSFNIK